MCQNDDHDIQYSVNAVTCSATRVIEQEEERRFGEGKGEKPEGLSLIPEPFVVSGADLSTFRESYYKAEAERREANRP